MVDRTASARAEAAANARSDAAVLDALARRYTAPLTKYFAKRLGASADVDDLVQEVFVRLANRADIAAIDGIEAYVFRAAGNILKDRHRRQTARHAADHQPIDEDHHGRVEISPERVLIGKDSLERVESALMVLPERTRDIFVLRFLEELSVAEISRMIAMTPRGVDYHLAKALDHLSKVLGRS